MADNRKQEQELEKRKDKRKDKQLSEEDLGTEVSGGSITNVNYTETGKITDPIKQKI